MQKIMLFLFCLSCITASFAQVPKNGTTALGINDYNKPVKVWDKRFGGDKDEELKAIVATSNEGYLLGGHTFSGASGDKKGASRGINDYWVVKTDAQGNKLWDISFGGNDTEYLTAICPAKDGGYLLGGASMSAISGDRTAPSEGESDYWVVKIDANGRKRWDMAYGGSGFDFLNEIVPTVDGGFLLGGTSSSGNSNTKKSALLGESDYWVVKIDANGNRQWDKTFGGAQTEMLVTLIPTNDGNYLLGGYAESCISGNTAPAAKEQQGYLVVKIDAKGNKIWDKCYGSLLTDNLSALAATKDGGCLLGGYSVKDDKNRYFKGAVDYWVAKVDPSGNKEWEKNFGGDGTDMLYALSATDDGGFLLGGVSNSGISGDKTINARGNLDTWILKIDANGNKIWDTGFGGDGEDYLQKMISFNNSTFVLGCYSSSSASGDVTQPKRGNHDFWIIKIKPGKP